MTQRSIFLSARWEYLVMLNYRVPADVLIPYLPKGLELDTWNGHVMASLVGFLFNNTKVFGVGWPWHTNFEEVNLRFYVKRFDGSHWRRGVVFISEVVPRFLIACMANTLYNEHYRFMPMRHSIAQNKDSVAVTFEWKIKKEWAQLSVTADAQAVPISVGSEEEFIFEHYWGYNQLANDMIIEYGVEHPRWSVYPVTNYHLRCNIERMYGSVFVPYLSNLPTSVFLAKGSEVVVRKPQLIRI